MDDCGRHGPVSKHIYDNLSLNIRDGQPLPPGSREGRLGGDTGVLSMC